LIQYYFLMPTSGVLNLSRRIEAGIESGDRDPSRYSDGSGDIPLMIWESGRLGGKAFDRTVTGVIVYASMSARHGKNSGGRCRLDIQIGIGAARDRSKNNDHNQNADRFISPARRLTRSKSLIEPGEGFTLKPLD
jgi:hypothetical protein